ncbi:MAG TPA: branched-chain amino acid ABC transporter permease [Alphaproteobacteria bacterium]
MSALAAGRGAGAVILAAVVVVIAALVPFVTGTYVTGIGLNLLMWLALTQSWIVLSGMAGYVSLGIVVFVGIGSYVMVLLWQAVPIWLAIPIAGAAAAGFAALVGIPVLRVRGPYFVILTFGLAEFVKYVVVNIEAVLGKFSRLVMGAPDIVDLYLLMLTLAVLATGLTVYLGRTRFGSGLRAIRENEEAAETLGVPVARFKMIAFTLSAVIPGIVGAILVLRTGYFDPVQSFNPVVSFTVVTIAVIGGADDARGPLFGAAFLTLLSELLWANAPQVYMILLGILLIVFVLFIPGGVFEWIAARRRLADHAS